MSDHHNRMLKSSTGPAIATGLSRLLGLVRTMLEAAVLGGGVFAGAWQIAFMVPNLFRRILGEGALGTALIPVITHTEEKAGIVKVQRDLAAVFAVLSTLLAGIVVLVSLASLLLKQWVSSAQWALAFQLLPLLMPYAFFICLVGIAGAILNSRRVFFLPALGALLLNVFMIGGLLAGLLYFKPDSGSDFVKFLEKLSLLVLLSGLIQLLLMLYLLHRYRIFPAFVRNFWKNTEVLKELGRLVLPGLIGASAVQISLSIDILLASTQGDMAVPSLNNTVRIIDLPIGIFAISFGAVLMSNMSRSAARNDFPQIARDLVFGLRHVCFACIPMAVFFILFREPVLRLTYLRGNFTPAQLQETMYVTLFYGLGILPFCALKVVLPAFYSRKQMIKPLKVSLLCIAVNIILNLILMWPLRQGGIALATVIASLLNNTLLLWLLKREGIDFDWAVVFKSLLRCCVAAGLAGCVSLLYPLLSRQLSLPVVHDLAALGVALAGFSIIYLAVSRLLGGREFSEFLSIFRIKIKST